MWLAAAVTDDGINGIRYGAWSLNLTAPGDLLNQADGLTSCAAGRPWWSLRPVPWTKLLAERCREN